MQHEPNHIRSPRHTIWRTWGTKRAAPKAKRPGGSQSKPSGGDHDNMVWHIRRRNAPTNPTHSRETLQHLRETLGLDQRSFFPTMALPHKGGERCSFFRHSRCIGRGSRKGLSLRPSKSPPGNDAETGCNDRTAMPPIPQLLQSERNQSPGEPTIASNGTSRH